MSLPVFRWFVHHDINTHVVILWHVTRKLQVYVDRSRMVTCLRVPEYPDGISIHRLFGEDGADELFCQGDRALLVHESQLPAKGTEHVTFSQTDILRQPSTFSNYFGIKIDDSYNVYDGDKAHILQLDPTGFTVSSGDPAIKSRRFGVSEDETEPLSRAVHTQYEALLAAEGPADGSRWLEFSPNDSVVHYVYNDPPHYSIQVSVGDQNTYSIYCGLRTSQNRIVAVRRKTGATGDIAQDYPSDTTTFIHLVRKYALEAAEKGTLRPVQPRTTPYWILDEGGVIKSVPREYNYYNMCIELKQNGLRIGDMWVAPGEVKDTSDVQAAYDTNNSPLMTKLLNELGIDDDCISDLRGMFKKSFLSGPEEQSATVSRCRSAKVFFEQCCAGIDAELVRNVPLYTSSDNSRETEWHGELSLYKSKPSGENFFVAKSYETDFYNTQPSNRITQVGTWEGPIDKVSIKVVVTKTETHFRFDYAPNRLYPFDGEYF